MHASDSPGDSARDTSTVCVVVLNRNGRGYTVECLRSLAALTYPAVSVLLIDNGCSDFTPEEVRALHPHARYVRTEVNLGFTGGVTLGIRNALEAGVDYVFLLNNDTIMEAGAMGELISIARSDARIGVVGAKLLQLDAPGYLESVGVEVNLRWGRLYQIGFGERDVGQYDRTAEVPAVSGGAMLLSRAACQRLGGFDDRYFRYLEDVDVCLRARRAGFRVLVAPRARVHHKGKGMSGGQTSPLILYYGARNHLLLMAEYGEPGQLRRAGRSAVIALLNVAYAIREPGDRLGRLRAVRRAVRDYRHGVTGAGPGDDIQAPRTGA